MVIEGLGASSCCRLLPQDLKVPRGGAELPPFIVSVVFSLHALVPTMMPFGLFMSLAFLSLKLPKRTWKQKRGLDCCPFTGAYMWVS